MEAPEEDCSPENKSEDSSEVKGKDSSEVMSIAGGPVDMSKLPPIPQEMPNHETLSDEVTSPCVETFLFKTQGLLVSRQECQLRRLSQRN